MISKYWIEDQIKWFRQKAPINFQKNGFNEKASNIFFLLGLSVSVLLFLFELFLTKPNLIEISMPAWLSSFLVVLSIMSMTIGAAILVYKEKRVFNEQYEDYIGMLELFNNAQKIILAYNIADKQKIIFILGKEFIKDSENWLLYNKLRPIQFPKG